MRTVIQASFAAVNLYIEYFLGLIVSITIARSLSADEYGIYASVIWLAGMVTVAINSGLSITVTKFVAEFNQYQNERLPGLFYTFNTMLIKRMSLVLALALLLVFTWQGLVKIDRWLFIVIVLCSMFKAFYVYRVSILKGMQNFKNLAKVSLIANPINLILVAICGYFMPSLDNFLFAYCLVCAAFGLSIFFFQDAMPKPSNKLPVAKDDISRIRTQVLSATAIVFLGALIFRQSQTLVLESNNLLAQAGFFNIAFILAASALKLVPGIYQEVLLPKIARAAKQNAFTNTVEQAQRYLLILCVMVVIPAVVYSHVVIDILYGAKYHEATFALQVLLVLKALMVINDGANLTLISKDKQVSMSKAYLVLGVIAVVLSIIITPSYALNGALVVYGILVFCFVASFQFLARKEAYKFIPFTLISKIMISGVFALVPTLLVNHYIYGFVSAMIGSMLFVVAYVHFLIFFGAFDQSAKFLLQQIANKVPNGPKQYFTWCSNRIN